MKKYKAFLCLAVVAIVFTLAPDALSADVINYDPGLGDID